MENHSLLVLLGQAQCVLKAIGASMVESTMAKDLGYCDDFMEFHNAVKRIRLPFMLSLFKLEIVLTM